MRKVITAAGLLAALILESPSLAQRTSGQVVRSREPTEAEMKAAVLSLITFRMQRFGMQVTITYFEKQGCEKAQGRIGFNCDFLVRYGGNGALDFANALIGADAASQASGRFYLRNGSWDYIQDKRED